LENGFLLSGGTHTTIAYPGVLFTTLWVINDGQLPDPVTLSINGVSQANELNQHIVFGNSVVFEVDLSGNPPPAGNSLALSFHDQTDANGILPGNFFGEVSEIDVNATSTALQVFRPSTTIVPNETATLSREPATSFCRGGGMGSVAAQKVCRINDAYRAATVKER
jgi:hypothetical protein